MDDNDKLQKRRARARRWYEKNRQKRVAAMKAWRAAHGTALDRAQAKGPEAVERLRERIRRAGKKLREKRRAGKPVHPSKGPGAVKLIIAIPPSAGVLDAARRQHPDLGWLVEHFGAIAVRRMRHKNEARRDFAVWTAARASLPARPVAEEFTRWLEALGRGEHGGTPLSKGSLANIYWRCAALYDTARMLGRPVRNVVRESPEPKNVSHPGAYSWRVVLEGFPRLIAAAADWRERAFFLTLRYTGLRIREVLGLRPEHVILLPGGEVQLQVVTQRARNSALGPDQQLKHDRQRRILPISNPDLISALLRARRESPTVVRTRDAHNRPLTAPSPYLFPFSVSRVTQLEQRFHAVLPELPAGVGWHAFRHAFSAEARLIARATIDELSQWLGHSSTSVTQTYLRSLLGEQPDLASFAARVAAAQLQRPVAAAPSNVTALKKS